MLGMPWPENGPKRHRKRRINFCETKQEFPLLSSFHNGSVIMTIQFTGDGALRM
jgi:hypothetical protein